MKKTFLFLFVAALVLGSCQTKPEVKPVDTAAEKAKLDSLFTIFNNSFNQKDVTTIAGNLSENLAAWGTDPSEFWPKKNLVDEWTKMFADTAVHINYTVEKREINVAPDGNSAMVVEQYVMPSVSKKLWIRTIYHTIKADNKWMIDFISWNFLTKNEDVAVVDKALAVPMAKK
ncbi:MAG TPA: nuclear transport factor 2 family protein [Bacteroidales bacterium]|nr:nuclear transport factor 2 family protein [Bacteroidales bacterium]